MTYTVAEVENVPFLVLKILENLMEICRQFVYITETYQLSFWQVNWKELYAALKMSCDVFRIMHSTATAEVLT